ncbi:hypothetical protein [Kribbella sp. NPDC049227]|uniref:hypothetical protein n=1 Tax=Kribbella sp. NPDC049227 TaxID=3364113 RepID=UPI00371F3FF7
MTITAPVEADDSQTIWSSTSIGCESGVAAAETVMKKMDAGWDPTELREPYNAAVTADVSGRDGAHSCAEAEGSESRRT